MRKPKFPPYVDNSTSKLVQDILFEATDNLVQCERRGEHLLSPGPFHSESKFCGSLQMLQTIESVIMI
jgi:hypothetical protein